MTSSFCERINSCVNLVGTKNNSLLSDYEIDMMVTLRMNRDFMEHMWLYYPEVIKTTHPTFDTIIFPQDILDEESIKHVYDKDMQQSLVPR